MTEAENKETAAADAAATDAPKDDTAPTAEPDAGPAAAEAADAEQTDPTTSDDAPTKDDGAPSDAKGETPAKAEPAKAEQEAAEADDEASEHTPRAKPELPEGVAEALGQRRVRKAKTPTFRRHEWWRYKKLGGKDAPWRRPTGTHSKQRRHFAYRPPVVSIGYGGPAMARGLHPSGFQEVLVHRPEDLEAIDAKTQAARIGGTVGGRKAEAIEKKAGEMGIRVLNPRGEA